MLGHSRQSLANKAPMPGSCDHAYQLDWDRVDMDTFQATCVCGAVLEKGRGSEEVEVVGHVAPREVAR